jgi:3-isopropylmalate/(R)-2-methylmalate dehydratase large subunit
MTESLQSRAIEKRPTKLRFDGRVLFLVDDADLLRRQLDGEDLSWPVSASLRDNISTDEITPAYICYYFDETLGEFPYLGLKAGDQFPVERGSVKSGGFVCSVSGKRRGKGSSREQSPPRELPKPWDAHQHGFLTHRSNCERRGDSAQRIHQG